MSDRGGVIMRIFNKKECTNIRGGSGEILLVVGVQCERLGSQITHYGYLEIYKIRMVKVLGVYRVYLPVNEESENYCVFILQKRSRVFPLKENIAGFLHHHPPTPC